MQYEDTRKDDGERKVAKKMPRRLQVLGFFSCFFF
jgi:hypothetical protein